MAIHNQLEIYHCNYGYKKILGLYCLAEILLTLEQQSSYQPNYLLRTLVLKSSPVPTYVLYPVPVYGYNIVVY